MVSFLLAFLPIFYMRYSSPHSCYMLSPSHAPRLDHSNYSWRRVHVMKLLIIQTSSTSRHFIPLRFKCSLQRPVHKHPQYNSLTQCNAWILTSCKFIYKIIQTMVCFSPIVERERESMRVCVCVCVCMCFDMMSWIYMPFTSSSTGRVASFLQEVKLQGVCVTLPLPCRSCAVEMSIYFKCIVYQFEKIESADERDKYLSMHQRMYVCRAT
jgi:hypothetical protein